MPVEDTLRTDCQDASTDYSTYLNAIQLELTGRYDNADSISFQGFEPAVPNTYTFPGGCSDSIFINYVVRDTAGGTTDFPYVFIVIDTAAPIFPGITDSLFLVCASAIPSADSLFLGLEECVLDTAWYTEDIQAGGNCPNDQVINRTFFARDSCGRETLLTQYIMVADSVAPDFIRPPDVELSCALDAENLELAGNISNPTDNCTDSADILLSYIDVIEEDSCLNQRIIRRLWSAEDACGNSTFKQQIITIRDTLAPTFTAPGDTVISCLFGDDSFFTGRPANIMDNCSPEDSIGVRSEDVVISGSCANDYTVVRKWFVEDQCGNIDSSSQTIQVVDEQAPVFDTLPSDLILTCASGVNYEAFFTDWVNRKANAGADDNCTRKSDLVWQLNNAGTFEPASFPERQCSGSGPLIFERIIDVIVMDECGRSDTSQAVFSVFDQTPPVIVSCPVDTIISTTPGDCNATFDLQIPQVEENCSRDTVPYSITGVDTITTSASPGLEGETPVDPMFFRLPINLPAPVNALNGGLLSIRLRNVDGEVNSEHFQIFGEDGSLLGISAPTDMACGDSDTTLSLSIAQINAWAVDGFIEIRLAPNIPDEQNGQFSINDICTPQSTVEIELNFTAKTFDQLGFSYRINQGDLAPVDSLASISVQLAQGVNRITYFVSDCAGLMDSCSYLVTVEDKEPPMVFCPDSIQVTLDSGTCVAPVKLPLPSGADDNCGVENLYDQTLPGDSTNAFFAFSFDPNLGDYLALPKTYTFNNVAANAIAPVNLTISVQLDLDSENAFLAITGDDGDTLLVTQQGDASCDQLDQLSLTIPAETFNHWASDGTVTISLLPNKINMPSGSPGEGINPCDTITMNNSIDSISRTFVRIQYTNLLPIFYTEGATVTPPTPMPFPQGPPTLDFELGRTEVFYIINDFAGNPDTCSFSVTVRDEEPPVARCQPTTLFINPSGLQVETIDVSEIDAGSSDNCGIDTMLLAPSTFTCDQADAVDSIALTVIDRDGNSASCSTIVRIENLEPQPTANSGICGNDTLFLFANPPPATGGVVYTYRWTGPNGFTSIKENPSIPNVGSVNAGSYEVMVSGITGCTSSGVVEVAIENLPQTPEVITDKVDFCEEEDVVFRSSVSISGETVRYRWFRGNPPNGQFVTETIVPSLTLPAPHSVSTYTYYVLIVSEGCESSPSASKTVRVNQRPIAVVQDSAITECAGGEIILGTQIAGPGITYQWTGPNGFNSTSQFPQAITNASTANAGTYRLVVFRNGCPSDPDFVNVNILPRPDQPEISNTGPVCEGESLRLTTRAKATTYHWIAPDLTEFITSDSSFEINVADNSARGSWRLFVTEFGCDSRISFPTEVEVYDLPDLAASARPGVVCENSNLVLSASPVISNATYRWEGPNGFTAVGPTVNLNDVQLNQSGLYRVFLATPDGCDTSTTVNVSVIEGVEIIAVTNDASECLAGPTDIRLQASTFPDDDGSFTYEWTGPNGFRSNDRIAIIPNGTALNNGNYQVVVRTSDGCASAMGNTIVGVNDPPPTPPIPAVSPSTPAPFCTGNDIILLTESYTGQQVTYTWITPAGVVDTNEPELTIPSASGNDSGDYSVFVTVNNCISNTSPKRRVNVSDRPDVTATSNSPVCEGTSIQLTATQIPGATYSWQGPEFTSSVRNPSIPNADSSEHAGEYTLVVDVAGCASALETIIVDIKPAPTQPQLVANTPICISEADALLRLSVREQSLSEGASYAWYDAFGPLDTTLAGVLDITDFSNYGEGLFRFTSRAFFEGCFSPAADSVRVQLNSIPDIQAFAGLDFSECDNENVVLNAEAPEIGSGTWTLVPEDTTGQIRIVNPNRAQTMVTGLLGGQTYNFQWTLSNGACTNYSSDEVRVTINFSETASAGENIISCSPSDIQLSAQPSANNSGIWTQSDVQQLLGVTIVDPANPNSPIAGMQAGNLYSFTWTVNSGCGESADEVFVLISDPNPFAGADQDVCNSDGFAELEAEEPNEGSQGVWSSPDSSILFADRNEPNTTARGLKRGANTLIWEVDQGVCGLDSRDTVIVTYQPNPEANDDFVEIEFGQETAINVLANDRFTEDAGLSIVQQPNNGSIEIENDSVITYRPNLNFVGTDRFFYELCSPGCECAMARVTIEIGSDTECTVPNIITPNGDGINDTFLIPCLLDQGAYPNSQVIIFNEWGDEVFRSPSPYQNDWRGTYNGEDLPVGTYFYIVSFGDLQDPQNGYLMIQR